MATEHNDIMAELMAIRSKLDGLSDYNTTRLIKGLLSSVNTISTTLDLTRYSWRERLETIAATTYTWHGATADSTAGPLAFHGSASINSNAEWTNTWDSTRTAWYLANATGVACTITDNSGAIATFLPYGPYYTIPAFDMDGGAITLPPTTMDCLVLEVYATFTAAQALDTRRGIGFMEAATTQIMAAASHHIAIDRRSGGSGWVLNTSDGTTATETAEASDTSDSTPHIFRIEWHAKATPEARLYVDGTLKVTKTTNLPSLSTPLPVRLYVEVPLGDASDTVRWYSWVSYWKDSSA